MKGDTLVLEQISLTKGNIFGLLFKDDGKSTAQLGFYQALSIVLGFGLSTYYNYVGVYFSEGIFSSAFYAIVVAVLTQMCMLALLFTWRYGMDLSYSGVWRNTISKHFAFLPRLFILFAYVYEVLFLSDVARREIYAVLTDLFPSVAFSQPAIGYVFALLIVLLFCFRLELQELLFASYINLFAVAASIILLIYVGATKGFTASPGMFRLSSTFGSQSGFIGLANFYHPFIHQILKNMPEPTGKTCMRLSLTASVIVMIVTVFFGVMAAYIFPVQFELYPVFAYYTGVASDIGCILDIISSFISCGFFSNLAIKNLVEMFVTDGSTEKSGLYFGSIVGFLFLGSFGLHTTGYYHAYQLLGNIGYDLVVLGLPYVFFFVRYRFKRLQTSIILGICGLLCFGGIALHFYYLFTGTIPLLD